MSPDHPECPRTTIFQRVVAGVQSVGLLAEPLAAAGRYRNAGYVERGTARTRSRAVGVSGRQAGARAVPRRVVPRVSFRSRVTGPDEHAYGTRYTAIGHRRTVGGAVRVGVTARNSSVIVR